MNAKIKIGTRVFYHREYSPPSEFIILAIRPDGKVDLGQREDGPAIVENCRVTDLPTAGAPPVWGTCSEIPETAKVSKL